MFDHSGSGLFDIVWQQHADSRVHSERVPARARETAEIDEPETIGWACSLSVLRSPASTAVWYAHDPDKLPARSCSVPGENHNPRLPAGAVISRRTSQHRRSRAGEEVISNVVFCGSKVGDVPIRRAAAAARGGGLRRAALGTAVSRPERSVSSPAAPLLPAGFRACSAVSSV
jgi:hypothetical protein